MVKIKFISSSRLVMPPYIYSHAFAVLLFTHKALFSVRLLCFRSASISKVKHYLFKSILCRVQRRRLLHHHHHHRGHNHQYCCHHYRRRCRRHHHYYPHRHHHHIIISYYGFYYSVTSSFNVLGRHMCKVFRCSNFRNISQ